MSAIAICRYCAKSILPNAIGGLCPECLLKAALASNAGSQPNAAFSAPSVEELAKGFPQFEIIELIGRGGMGAVYKARQPALNRFVALKVLPADYMAANPGFAERFQREARALARLNHPNIVAVYEFGQTAGFYFLVMEFVDGVTLRSVLREGKLAPAQALGIVPQICEALQFAHDAGVVHRDIKPENVLIDRSGRVKVADFGLAKILSPNAPELGITQVGHRMGTPHYMAPEQVEKPNQVDHRADIYSLGVVFYELLTGELPLGRFSPPSRRAQIDFRLDEVVLRALEKEPAQRYQHVSEVKTGIEDASVRPVKRNGRALAAAVIVAVIAIIYANFRSREISRAEADSLRRKAEDIQRATHIINEAKRKPVEDEASASLRSLANELLSVTSIDPLTGEAVVNWPERVKQMNTGNWRKALAIAESIATGLPPDEGLALVTQSWNTVTNAESRKQFLKAFTFAHHEKLMAVLELGVRDPAPEVQSWAFSYLKNVTGYDMTENYNDALQFVAAYRDRTLDEVLGEVTARFSSAISANEDSEVEQRLKELKETTLLRDHEAGAALESALEHVVQGRSEHLVAEALDAASSLKLSPEWHGRVTLPRLSTNNPVPVRIAAAHALDRGAGDWAVEPLLNSLSDLKQIPDVYKNSLTFGVGSALAATQSRKAIQLIIEIMQQHNDYATLYGLGYFALNPLTGVSYDEKHDANWWKKWWENNRARFM
jgi:serine/threonine protein kinase